MSRGKREGRGIKGSLDDAKNGFRLRFGLEPNVLVVPPAVRRVVGEGNVMDVIFKTERRALVVYWTSANLSGWSVNRWGGGRWAVSVWRFVVGYRDGEHRLLPKRVFRGD